ncbi:hypothetical protein V8G54_033936 [Vigna mungo]|uniref:Protein FAR1-RELATED SEQUENCE n=1 Tax=Vigna mungo TaxID=3915 RepID=A0AAQ3RGS7_VIGMU
MSSQHAYSNSIEGEDEGYADNRVVTSSSTTLGAVDERNSPLATRPGHRAVRIPHAFLKIATLNKLPSHMDFTGAWDGRPRNWPTITEIGLLARLIVMVCLLDYGLELIIMEILFFWLCSIKGREDTSFTWAIKVGVAMNIRNQAGEEARMRQKYHNPPMKTSFPIKEHAASILTPYAFELLQHEIELSTKYLANVIDNDSYSVQHHTKLDGSHSVTWIKEKDSIHCSCKEFEFSGILCRHVIQVLLKNDYFSIL